MSESSSSNDVLVSFAVQGLELAQDFHVLQFQGQEEISRLFRFDLMLAADSADVAFDKVVGRMAVLTLTGARGARYVHGLVAAFQLRDKGRRFTVYQATIVPLAWRLKHRTDCRIFQKKNIQQIIDKVLSDGKVEHKFHLKGGKAPPTREYCVQYRESDWSFVARLLEEEGFFFFFENLQQKHVLHMGNDYNVHPPIAGEAVVPFHAPDTTTPGEEHISSLFYQEQVRSGSVTLNDFNFEKPNLDLKAPKPGKRDADLEVYDYPGLYEVPERGATLADIRREESEALRALGEGQSDCTRLSCGHHFTLDGYYRKGLNKKRFLITRVSHRGEKHQDLEAGAVSNRIRYSNAFHCMPRKTPFRPLRITPRPRVEGCQTAIVVGPSTEEIYTDKHGRVKVHFHWDRLGQRNEHSSCWVRVSQLWAGKSWGAMFIPRIGHEVIVDFLEGDPDRPIIIGRVYHAQNPVPHTLPANKTQSTIKSDSSLGGGGSNEIRFEDKKGKEEVYLHAQKDYDLVVENDRTSLVKHDRKETVVNDQSVTVQNNRSLAVTNASSHTAKTILLQASESITLKVGSSVVVLKPSELTINGGAVTASADGGLCTIKGRLVKINC